MLRNVYRQSLIIGCTHIEIASYCSIVNTLFICYFSTQFFGLITINNSNVTTTIKQYLSLLPWNFASCFTVAIQNLTNIVQLLT